MFGEGLVYVLRRGLWECLGKCFDEEGVVVVMGELLLDGGMDGGGEWW